MKKSTKRLIISLAVAVGILLSTVAGFLIYASDYYRATKIAATAFSSDLVEERELSDGSVALIPSGEAKTGFIFYPGGKVEHTAYLPLLRELAGNGILAVVLKVPLNLAILDSNAADSVTEEFPQIGEWYLGGHSLGGSVASMYAEGHPDSVKGLVLLGAYSTSDLSGASFPVLSIYGSEDKVMNREKYEECKANLPAILKEYVISGGNHAFFGMYGNQAGDGNASVSNEEQIRETAIHILSLILG